MGRPPFFKAVPVVAAIFVLASLSAHGASLRGGSSTADRKFAAQAAAVQSARQEGSVSSDASADGAARRERNGSFVNTFLEVIRRAITSRNTQSIVIADEDRQIAEHLADVDAFVRETRRHGRVFFAKESNSLERGARNLILYGALSAETQKMYEFIEELSTSDEEALHALFLLANYRSAESLKKDRPGFIAGINRIEARLKAAGLAQTDADGTNWHISREAAHAVLAAPGARTLLREITDSETQKNVRAALAERRATILNVAKAQESVERMQALKKYIAAMYKEAGVKVPESEEFMGRLRTYSGMSANGGVILVFNKELDPIAIQTAHGSITYSRKEGSASPTVDGAKELLKKYIRDLGLEFVPERSLKVHREFIVTRLPDGTKIPKASAIEAPPVSSIEVGQLVLEVPETVRRGISVDPN